MELIVLKYHIHWFDRWSEKLSLCFVSSPAYSWIGEQEQHEDLGGQGGLGGLGGQEGNLGQGDCFLSSPGNQQFNLEFTSVNNGHFRNDPWLNDWL